jgi:glutathione S-transferase
MPDFAVHTIPGSPFGRSALVALMEKGADWRLAPVTPGAHRQAPHTDRHPFARIPVLEHDGFWVYETQAILRYLDRVLPNPPLTPTDAKAAARMDQAMGVNDWYLFQGVGNVIGFQRIVGPRLRGLVPDEAAIAAAMPQAQTAFAALDRLLGEDAYFGGASLTLADILLAPQMDFLAQTPEWAALTEARPRLTAWMARVNARPSLQATTWDRVEVLAKAA